MAFARNLQPPLPYRPDVLHHPAMSTSAWYVMTNHEQSHCLTASEVAAHSDLDPATIQAIRRYAVDRGSPYLTVVEAAAFLRLKPRTLDNMRSNGVGPIYCKHGGRILYNLSDLIDWSQASRRRSTAERAP
jgi:hypothetical protein